jgi:hypothetical protein
VSAFSTSLWFDNVVTGRGHDGSYHKASKMKVFSAKLSLVGQSWCEDFVIPNSGEL